MHRRGWARGASHIWTPIQDFWEGSDDDRRDLFSSGANESRLHLTGRHLFVALQRSELHRKAFYADHAWVEVMRVGIRNEGGHYGCWFWPLRGSGMFVNVGRSLRSGNKHHLAALLQTPHHDRFLPNATAARGYDSFQVWRGGPQYGGSNARFHVTTVPAFELVLTGPGCVDVAPQSAKQNIHGPCVPTPIRAGWNASRSCDCDADASPLLNCLHAPHHSARARPARA